MTETHLTQLIKSLVAAQFLLFVLQSFFTDEDMSILKKCKLYMEDNWNKCDMVAIILFVIGLSCRYSRLWYTDCGIEETKYFYISLHWLNLVEPPTFILSSRVQQYIMI